MRSKLALLILLLLFSTITLFAQYDILELSEARYSIESVEFEDKILFIGGSQGDNSVDYLNLSDNSLTSEFYSSDGFTGAKILSNNNYAFFYNLSGVNTALREYMVFNNETLHWSSGKFDLFDDADHGYIIGNTIYLIDDSDTDNIYSYNLDNKEWNTEQLPFNYRNFTVTQDNDKVYFTGGLLDDQNLSNIEILDINTMSWTSYNLNSTRRSPNVLLHENYLITHGGFNDFSREVEIFNLDNFESTTVNTGENNRDAFMIANNSKLILAGDDIADAIIIDLDNLDLTTFKLEDTSRLPHLTGENLGDKIYLAGGSNNFTSINIYDTKNNTWEKLELNEGRQRVNMISSGNRLYIAGGQTASGETNELIIIQDLTVSTHELQYSAISIYPNPTDNVIHIDTKEELNYNAKLYTLNGQLIDSTTDSKICVESIPNGTYLLEITTDISKSKIFKTIIISR